VVLEEAEEAVQAVLDAHDAAWGGQECDCQLCDDLRHWSWLLEVGGSIIDSQLLAVPGSRRNPVPPSVGAKPAEEAEADPVPVVKENPFARARAF
jgi:hypothetical protein